MGSPSVGAVLTHPCPPRPQQHGIHPRRQPAPAIPAFSRNRQRLTTIALLLPFRAGSEGRGEQPQP